MKPRDGPGQGWAGGRSWDSVLEPPWNASPLVREMAPLTTRLNDYPNPWALWVVILVCIPFGECMKTTQEAHEKIELKYTFIWG